VPFPGYDRLRTELTESTPRAMIAIATEAGEAVRLLDVPAKSGMGRITWDVRGPSPDAIDLTPRGFRAPWESGPVGPLVAPGRYTATLLVVSADGVRSVGSPQSFTVKPVANLRPGTDFVAVAAFQREVAESRRRLAAANAEVGRVRDVLRHARAAVLAAPRADPALLGQIDGTERSLAAIVVRLSGDPARRRLNQSDVASISSRLFAASSVWATRQPATATQRAGVAWATTELAAVTRDLRALVSGDLARLEAALEAAGAPATPGRRPPE
jgi:hypothetical protein